MKTGLIFDIKRYAIHDGPGIRTTVFFKGCPFSCWWCHNPESLVPTPQGLYHNNRCIGCGECINTCPSGAISLETRGVVTNLSLCKHCGSCARICPAEARELVGRFISVDRLMEIIKKDVLFYDESGGGVTFSGGEPLLQADFLLEVLEVCGRHDIHRAVDTAGYASEDILMAVAEKTDLFLFDLKLMDPEKHKKHTGISNQKILGNLEILANQGANITVRIPFIPGVNDEPENIERTGSFISALPGIRNVDILPYHNSAKNKYLKFGLDHPPINILSPSREQLSAVAGHLESFGLQIRIGG